MYGREHPPQLETITILEEPEMDLIPGENEEPIGLGWQQAQYHRN
jgi:hypothetical protein